MELNEIDIPNFLQYVGCFFLGKQLFIVILFVCPIKLMDVVEQNPFVTSDHSLSDHR